jgi:hypothetical protein
MKDTSLDLLAFALPTVQQLERYEERLEAGHRLTMMALILTTTVAPEWATPLDNARAVVLIGPDPVEQRRVLARLQRDPEARDLGDQVLVLDLRTGAAEAALAYVGGVVRETAVLGARGDGKSICGATAQVLYAERHRAQGGALPVRILVATDTFMSHRAKLCRSLEEALWHRLWVSREDRHVWVATIGGVEYVHLELIGVEDQGALDRMRQAAHALWLEEAAPAGIEASSSGLSEDALGIGITSLRLPSYAHPVLLTSNYGSESHWTWQRYAVDRHPGTHLVRLRPGEQATEADRRVWDEALRGRGRPDLARRLVDGEPALIVSGKGVCEDIYNPGIHVSSHALAYHPGNRLLLGWDGGLTPTVIVATWNGSQLQVLASLVSKRAGTEQHIEEQVLPWLGRHGALEAEFEHCIDPAMTTPAEGDLRMSAEQVIRKRLGGIVREGPRDWAARRDPVLNMLSRLTEGGRPALVIDPGPDTLPLREALGGKWHYHRGRTGEVESELPVKDHPASDCGDGLCYIIACARPMRGPQDRARGPYQAKLAGAVNPVTWGKPPRVRAYWVGPWGAR